MLNQTRIRYAVNKVIGARDFEYEVLGDLEVFKFKYLDKPYTIFHYVESDTWLFNQVLFASINSVVKCIERLG